MRASAVIRLLATRLAGLVGTLLVASIVIYGAIYLAPGDPATLLAGSHATPSVLATIHAQYHLNDPIFVRYWLWLRGVLHGNFGESFVYRQSVGSLIGARVGTTLFLIVYASVLILVIGIGLGVLGGLSDRAGSVVTVVTSIGLAIPSYVAAIILIVVFAVDLNWLPASGSGSGFVDQLRHMTMPAIALAASWTALVAQMTKTAVRREQDSEHVDTAVSRGLKRSGVVRRHVLRNAMIPITTTAGLTIAGLVASDVVVEQAFGLGGLGSFLVQAVEGKDFAVVQALALLMVIIFVLINSAVDLLNGLLDPRIARSRTE